MVQDKCTSAQSDYRIIRKAIIQHFNSPFTRQRHISTMHHAAAPLYDAMWPYIELNVCNDSRARKWHRAAFCMMVNWIPLAVTPGTLAFLKRSSHHIQRSKREHGHRVRSPLPFGVQHDTATANGDSIITQQCSETFKLIIDCRGGCAIAGSALHWAAAIRPVFAKRRAEDLCPMIKVIQ